MEQTGGSTSSSNSLRVLSRDSPSTAAASFFPLSSSSCSSSSSSASSNHPQSQTLNNPSSLPSDHPLFSPAPLDGIVVIGFVGSRPTTDLTHLLNRILDANIFGSGDLDTDLLLASPDDGLRQCRPRISYYHDRDKGVLFLHLSSLLMPSDVGGASVLEESESYHLRGMLFMFLVCHVIVFLHEGLRFDTQVLKKLRMLQAAKHALAPFIRSQVTPVLVPKSSSSPSVPTAPRGTSSVSPPGRRGGLANRRSSSISLMSGSGSHPCVLPGQCTPVILFVFCDDLSDGQSPSPNMDDLSNASSLTPSSSALGGIQKASLTLKGSGSVVMLARPTSKIEGSFKKRLHSSLDMQIRFLIKKCRILVGTEPSIRGAANANALLLFSLDASKIVALIDRSMNQRGESLDFVTDVIEDAYNSSVALDLFLLENQCQAFNNEEMQSIKDFIYRQSDILRGRGGLPSNANSGSVAGVGMVAAAAAAAAASAAAGKPLSAPELPSLENWLSSSNLILNALLSVEPGVTVESDDIKRLSSQRDAFEAQNGQLSQFGSYATEPAVSCLESSKGLTMKFSVSWCRRALPAAKQVYLMDLPACYPTSLHKAQLKKALHAFCSMVKGPATQMFAKKLEDECNSIWQSGRQLCDAISLTGKPCMHQRHNVKTSDPPSETVMKQHSSGYVFLHACACGRSRGLRDDPFDFESANATFNCFANCKDALPNLILLEGSSVGPFPQTSWSLLRLGGARYYEPLKGLLHTGFCSGEKFLLKWTISLEEQKGKIALSTAVTGRSTVISSSPDLKALPVMDEEMNKFNISNIPTEVQPGGSDNQRKASELVCSDDTSISFGKGLPSFTMRKPFSEVVAGTAGGESTFPVFRQSKQPKAIQEKVVKLDTSNQNDDRLVHVADDHQGSRRSKCIKVQESLHRPGSNCHTNDDSFLQIGSNIVPGNMFNSGRIGPHISLGQVTAYIGFEHECSYGHRFLLSPKHLMELDASYHSEFSERTYIETSNVLHEKVLPYSTTTVTDVNNTKKSNRFTVKHGEQQDSFTLFSTSGIEKFQSVHGLPNPHDSIEGLEGNLSHVRLDDGSSAFSLLNRNLPIYMNCPHCRSSSKQNQQHAKFASTISQLQRIFLVTPPFPIVLATCPVIQFEDSCLPPSTPLREQQSRSTLGCRVILPPESFLTLRLPFVYGIRMDDGTLKPLNHLEHQPELSAWLVKCTTLQVVSMGYGIDEDFHMQ